MRRKRDSARPGRPARGEEDTKEILDALRRVLRFIRTANASSRGASGLTAAQLFVIQTLADSADALSVNALADLTYTDQSTVSVMARRLEEKGLVARRRAATDRRRVGVALTPEGRRLIVRAPASPQQTLLEGIRGLPPAARAGLATFLPDLLRTMGLERAPAPMMFADDAAGRRTRSGRRSREGA